MIKLSILNKFLFIVSYFSVNQYLQTISRNTCTFKFNSSYKICQSIFFLKFLILILFFLFLGITLRYFNRAILVFLLTTFYMLFFFLLLLAKYYFLWISLKFFIELFNNIFKPHINIWQDFKIKFLISIIKSFSWELKFILKSIG